MNYASLIDKEQKAQANLNAKLEQETKKRDIFTTSRENFKLRPKKQLLLVPKLDANVLNKAQQDEGKRRARAEARGEDYKVLEKHKDILEQPRRIREIEAKNTELEQLNTVIRRENNFKERKVKHIDAEIREIDKKIKQLQLYLTESEKSLRYLDYASKHNIPFDDEDTNSLINNCNNHRNLYIAMKAYKCANKDDNKESLGYSKCHKGLYDCDNNVSHYNDDYSHIKCTCGKSGWVLSPLPDNENEDFDITSQCANGEVYGYGYCGADIDTDDEDDVEVLKLIAGVLVSDYNWQQSYYDQFTDDEKDDD